MRIFNPPWPLASLVCLLLPLWLGTAHAQGWAPIQTALDANGTVLPGPVLHFDLVRSDISVTVNNQALNSAEVANGYINFEPLQNGQYFADGALPAQESEVPALSSALRLNTGTHIRSGKPRRPGNP
jgi:hypothetical protein